MKDHQLIQLIYQSPLQHGTFLDLMDKLTDGAASSLDEEALLEHFAQSIAISARMTQLQHQQSVAESIFNQLKTGIILLDAKAQCVFANQPAEQLLQQGEIVSLKQSLLQFGKDELNQQLQQHLTDWVSGGLAEPQSLLAQPQVVVMAPVAEVAELLSMHIPSTAVAALFFSYALNDNEAVKQRLSELYQLTPVEADISCKLAAGQTLEQIAQSRQSKTATIRSYTKSIFSKTGTKRQAELMALVIKAPLQLNQVQQASPENSGQDLSFTIDGRRLTLRAYGPEHGNPIVLCHASLGCRLGVPLDLEFLQRHNLRLLVVDRAAIGLSDGPPYPNLAAFAQDLKRVLQQLKLERVKLVGVAAGGAYALACAHYLPAQVEQVLLLESFAPDVAENKIKGAPGYFRMMPSMVKRFPRIGDKILTMILQEFTNDWQKTMASIGKLFNSADAQVLLRQDIVKRAFNEGMESSRQGVQGLSNDIRLAHSDWGFELEAIHCRCVIAAGFADPVATRYAQVLQQLPNAQLLKRDNEGFAAMLYLNFGEILQQAGWLE